MLLGELSSVQDDGKHKRTLALGGAWWGEIPALSLGRLRYRSG